MTIREWTSKKKAFVLYQCTTWWRRQPDTHKSFYLYISNYIVTAFFFSCIVTYVLLFNNLIVRYVFMLPIMTMILVYFEYYYHWIRIGYKDSN